MTTGPLKRWQDGKRFSVFVEDHNGHRFAAIVYIADAINIRGALRVALGLETPCPHGCWIPSNMRLHPRSLRSRTPIRAIGADGGAAVGIDPTKVGHE